MEPILANDLTAMNKVPVLFSMIGPKTSGLFHSLSAPANPGKMEFDHIVEVFQTHFTPEPLVIAERFRFHKRNQCLSFC